MSFPAIIMYLVVACIGLPAAFRNPTAAALVMAWVASEAMFLVTGDSLPIEYYPFLDVFVIAVIMAKHEYCNQRPYRGTWHQLKCLLLERSPADRVVLLIFPVMWGLYIAPIHPYYLWYALWFLCIAQFVSAGAEALSRYLKARRKVDMPIIDRHLVVIPFKRRGADAVRTTPDLSGALLTAYRGGGGG